MATHTPWGPSQLRTNIARGLVFYSTASHGGYHVSPTLNKDIPEQFRNADGWYEEDCEALVVAYFLNKYMSPRYQTAEAKRDMIKQMAHWFPKATEQYLSS